MNILGKRIKNLRETSNLNQMELAKVLNISNTTLSQYETGQRVPSDDVKLNIAKYFNVSTDYLLGNSDIKNPYKEDNKELSEDDIITLAAHSIGHLDDLSEDEREKIRLAIKIALMNGKRTIKGE